MANRKIRNNTSINEFSTNESVSTETRLIEQIEQRIFEITKNKFYLLINEFTVCTVVDVAAYNIEYTNHTDSKIQIKYKDVAQDRFITHYYNLEKQTVEHIIQRLDEQGFTLSRLKEKYPEYFI